MSTTVNNVGGTSSLPSTTTVGNPGVDAADPANGATTQGSTPATDSYDATDASDPTTSDYGSAVSQAQGTDDAPVQWTSDIESQFRAALSADEVTGKDQDAEIKQLKNANLDADGLQQVYSGLVAAKGDWSSDYEKKFKAIFKLLKVPAAEQKKDLQQLAGSGFTKAQIDKVYQGLEAQKPAWDSSWNNKFKAIGLPDKYTDQLSKSGMSADQLQTTLDHLTKTKSTYTSNGRLKQLKDAGASDDEQWQVMLANPKKADFDKAVSSIKSEHVPWYKRVGSIALNLIPGVGALEYATGSDWITGEKIDRSNPLNIAMAGLSVLSVVPFVGAGAAIARGGAAALKGGMAAADGLEAASAATRAGAAGVDGVMGAGKAADAVLDTSAALGGGTGLGGAADAAAAGKITSQSAIASIADSTGKVSITKAIDLARESGVVDSSTGDVSKAFTNATAGLTKGKLVKAVLRLPGEGRSTAKVLLGQKAARSTLGAIDTKLAGTGISESRLVDLAQVGKTSDELATVATDSGTIAKGIVADAAKSVSTDWTKTLPATLAKNGGSIGTTLSGNIEDLANVVAKVEETAGPTVAKDVFGMSSSDIRAIAQSGKISGEQATALTTARGIAANPEELGTALETAAQSATTDMAAVKGATGFDPEALLQNAGILDNATRGEGTLVTQTPKVWNRFNILANKSKVTAQASGRGGFMQTAKNTLTGNRALEGSSQLRLGKNVEAGTAAGYDQIMGGVDTLRSGGAAGSMLDTTKSTAEVANATGFQTARGISRLRDLILPGSNAEVDRAVSSVAHGNSLGSRVAHGIHGNLVMGGAMIGGAAALTAFGAYPQLGRLQQASSNFQSALYGSSAYDDDAQQAGSTPPSKASKKSASSSASTKKPSTADSDATGNAPANTQDPADNTPSNSAATSTPDPTTQQPSVDPNTGMQIDPNTGYEIDPQSGFEVDQQTGVMYDPSTGWQVDQNTGGEIDPSSGNEYDAYNGWQIDMKTNADIDPNSGLEYDPMNGAQVDPTTGYDIDPNTNQEYDPTSNQYTGTTYQGPNGMLANGQSPLPNALTGAISATNATTGSDDDDTTIPETDAYGGSASTPGAYTGQTAGNGGNVQTQAPAWHGSVNNYGTTAANTYNAYASNNG